MSTIRQKRWGDRFDLHGAIAGFLLFVIIGLLAGSFVGWLAALALGCGAMNVTALILRRRAGKQAPQPGDLPDRDDVAAYMGPRRERSSRAPAYGPKATP